MNKLSYFLVAGAVALLAGTSSNEAAAQSTWNLGGSTCNTAQNSDPNSTTCTGSSGSTSATMFAVGNTGNVGGSAPSGTNGTFQLGQLVAYDPYGFGAFTGPNPTGVAGTTSETGYDNQHAFDDNNTQCVSTSNNTPTTACGGSQELMLIHFSTAVNLSQVAVTVFGADADVSVLRWDGPADGSSNQVNAGNSLQCETSANYIGSYSGTVSGGTCTSASGGWTLVSSLDALNNGITQTNPNPGGNPATDQVFNVASGYGYGSSGNTATTTKLSSWWIISTYNGPTVNTTDSSGNAMSLDNGGNDFFKILSYTIGATSSTCSGSLSGSNGTTATCTTNTGNQGVPEPGSLSLAGLALLGIWAGRRRIVAALAA